MAEPVEEKVQIEQKEQLRPAERSGSLFVQFLAFRVDPSWRRLPEDDRRQGRQEFAAEVHREEADLQTYAYSGLGLKMGLDLLLWRNAASVDVLQQSAGRLLLTGLGRYAEVSHSLLGLIRPSTYVKRANWQEQAIYSSQRSRYLVVYPFSKTPDWYLMEPEERQAMMKEHIQVGHRYPSVRQMLAYSFGLDDQEFIVAYEMDELGEFEHLVRSLRETEVRRFTLRDTPILTCIHHPLEEALALLG